MIQLKLKEIREKRNLRQHELGSVINSATSKISKIENGSQKLLLDEAIMLAEYLVVSITDLYVYKKERN